ncbi:MAG: hypothetical protein KJ069_28230 [Anaerolineae bacterium]|nr:hypothetical protein [Anaerolineae bacterium]
MSQLTFDEAKQRLVQRVDARLQNAHERRSLLLVAIIAAPFALGFTYFARSSREAPLWPFIPIIILYLLWNLGIYLGHRPISLTEYEALSAEEKERRVLHVVASLSDGNRWVYRVRFFMGDDRSKPVL